MRKTFFLILNVLVFSLYLSLASAQDFELATQEAGLEMVAATNGVAVADFDSDGDLDIYFVVHSTYDPQDNSTWNRLFENDGQGKFTDVTVHSGLYQIKTHNKSGPMGQKLGAAWGDYNNDGFPDIYLTNSGFNVLFKNMGDGTFRDVTSEAGVSGEYDYISSSCMWWDYDLDGDLDLYLSNWKMVESQNYGAPNVLYENINGKFSDVSAEAALADTGASLNAMIIDGNNDGLPDLYVVNDFGANRFYENSGEKKFYEKTAQYGLEDSGHGMGCTVGDYDSDGFLDIFIANLTQYYLIQGEYNALFRNTGNGFFENRASEMGVKEAGWGWGSQFFDCDHDGDEDLYVVNGFFDTGADRNFLFENNNGQFFSNIAASVKVNGDAQARGLVVFDYDKDGDQDLLVSNFPANEPPYLYKNNLADGNWLKISLEGTISNRDAVGTLIKLVSGEKTFIRQFDGIQFLAQNIIPVHFGLANAETIDSLIVKWPNGIIESYLGVAVNQHIKIKETEGIITGLKNREYRSITASPKIKISGTYPNPFNGSTSIVFNLTDAANVKLQIISPIGKVVRSIHRSYSSGGQYSIQWDVRNDRKEPVASSLYVYRIQIGNQAVCGKMLYLK